jgi:hypothetical protein
VNGWNVALDESQFCRKCSPEIKDPKSIFKMQYICSKCGEKTLYTNQKPQVAGWDIRYMQEIIQNLQKVAGNGITLDDSHLCRKCFPETKGPEYILKIEYADSKPQIVAGVSPADIAILTDFFSDGRLGFYHGDKPLEDYTKRLQELLGVEVK